MPIIAIIQFILHYLGLAGIILGIIALIFGNTGRGIELVIGGAFFIILKYIIGFICVPIVAYLAKRKTNLE